MAKTPPIVTELAQLETTHSAHLIFRGIAGSQAYGTAGPHSDVDHRGVYILPAAAYLQLQAPPEQVSSEKSDDIYYALRRFVELAASANPNILELLYLPADCVKLRSRYFEILERSRELFISRRVFESHVAYAHAQIKKARGHNKWINNPKPELPPTKDEFCWVVPRETNSEPAPAPPLRPIPLRDSNIDLAHCHAASLEHTPGVYRLYEYGSGAKGVFRGNNLVCESIPKEDESSRCVGLLIFNEPAYERAIKDHRNYWTWRERRNEARWISQERGEIDYDAKNLMHTFRLLMTAEAVFREGTPRVRFEGDQLNFLLSIRRGEMEYDHLIELAEEKVVELMNLRDRSSLPDEAPVAAATDLVMEITEEWERDHARANS